MEPFARLPRKLLNDDLMPNAAKNVYAALDGYLDKKTGDCSPPISRLMADLGHSERWIHAMLMWLEVHGWIVVQRQSGRRNRYLAEPADDSRRGFILKRGQSLTTAFECGGTPAAECGGTPAAECGGSAISPIEDLRIKKEGEPPSLNSSNLTRPARPVSLFADADRHWLRSAVNYLLGERPEFVHLRGWFPEVVAEFFLAQSWQRSADPETACFWAKRLTALGATEPEVRAAFDWALSTPAIDGAGKKIFGRPDHLTRIEFHVRSQRRRGMQLQSPGTATCDRLPEPSPAALAWSQAGEAEREEVRKRVRRRGRGDGGPMFDLECQRELQRLREEVTKNAN